MTLHKGGAFHRARRHPWTALARICNKRAWLLHLVREQRGGTALLAAVFQQRRATASGVGGDRAQQTLELVRAVAIELAVSAPRQLGDLGKEPRRHPVLALLEDENRQAEQPELTRLVTDRVDIFLAAIADE